ncbi:MAG: methyltransferase domain-containing protein, partial [Deltaproteobacteria bacterium]|nr:methyltransferase domain-containing protein [Deltaproteobacteria bacterium]
TANDPSAPEFWDVRFREGRVPWDAGGVPHELAEYLAGASGGGRALIPGCGAAYEVAAFHEAGYEVIAIDFSPAAVAAAARALGPLQGTVRLGDFFQYDFGMVRFDIIYERAFLCSLPRRFRPDYCARVFDLLRPGGLLIGFFFYDPGESGPPFGLGQGELHDLLKERFVLAADEEARSSVSVFAGRERWQVWRRLD